MAERTSGSSGSSEGLSVTHHAIVNFTRDVLRRELNVMTAALEDKLSGELRQWLHPSALDEQDSDAATTNGNVVVLSDHQVVSHEDIALSGLGRRHSNNCKAPHSKPDSSQDLKVSLVETRAYTEPWTFNSQTGYSALSPTYVQLFDTDENKVSLPISSKRTMEVSCRLSDGSRHSLEENICRRSPDKKESSRIRRLSLDLSLQDNLELFHSERGETTVRSSLHSILESTTFICLITSIIALNVACIGVQVDYMARHWTEEQPKMFRDIDKAFCIVFVFEIACRMCVYCSSFFVGPEWLGNLFDLSLVCIQIYDDFIVKLLPDDMQFGKGLSLLRIIRLYRLFRIKNFLHLLSEARYLIVSMRESMRTVVWAFGLLFLLMYVVGIYFTQTVTSYKIYDRDSHETQALDYNYGNLGRSMLTLFEAIASGVSWREAVDPLRYTIGGPSIFCFLFFIAFTIFVVLNVVTGVFVSSATEKAAEDRRNVLMFQLRELYRTVDHDGSGSMNWDKFNMHVQDPNMQTYLKAVELHNRDAYDLFVLLDTDDSDNIDETEFVNGCLRLHGSAKAIDLAMFMRDYNRFANGLADHSKFVQDTLAQMANLLNTLTKQQNVLLSRKPM